jgi:hypothetical protein
MFVMAGLDPAIHVFAATRKTWMPATSSAKTRFAPLRGHDKRKIDASSQVENQVHAASSDLHGYARIRGADAA